MTSLQGDFVGSLISEIARFADTGMTVANQPTSGPELFGGAVRYATNARQEFTNDWATPVMRSDAGFPHLVAFAARYISFFLLIYCLLDALQALFSHLSVQVGLRSLKHDKCSLVSVRSVLESHPL
ncbi:hypothetical protein B0G80_7382 [Paraburkholderia sp. BL6669N2]|nr:hypothetical protein B0G80_7382 [Paraburkholderia sp. BL6669N2]